MDTLENLEYFSTGGGFYTAQGTKGGIVYCVHSESPLELTAYRSEELTGENMIFSKSVDELDREEKEIFLKLYEFLC